MGSRTVCIFKFDSYFQVGLQKDYTPVTFSTMFETVS